MMALLWPLIRPFLGYIIGVVAIVGTVGGFYLKGVHEGHVAEKAKIEQEKVDAIGKANKARDRIRQLCTAKPDNCTPDDWFRD